VRVELTDGKSPRSGGGEGKKSYNKGGKGGGKKFYEKKGSRSSGSSKSKWG